MTTASRSAVCGERRLPKSVCKTSSLCGVDGPRERSFRIASNAAPMGNDPILQCRHLAKMCRILSLLNLSQQMKWEARFKEYTRKREEVKKRRGAEEKTRKREETKKRRGEKQNKRRRRSEEEKRRREGEEKKKGKQEETKRIGEAFPVVFGRACGATSTTFHVGGHMKMPPEELPNSCRVADSQQFLKFGGPLPRACQIIRDGLLISALSIFSNLF